MHVLCSQHDFPLFQAWFDAQALDTVPLAAFSQVHTTHEAICSVAQSLLRYRSICNTWLSCVHASRLSKRS
jgi:hypothetical protein